MIVTGAFYRTLELMHTCTRAEWSGVMRTVMVNMQLSTISFNWSKTFRKSVQMNYVVCTIYKARTIAIKVFDFVSASNCVLQLTLIPLLPALNGKISQLTLGIVPWSFRQDDIPGEGGAGADQRPAVSCHEHFIGGTRTVNSFICHIAQSMKSIPSLSPASLQKQWIPNTNGDNQLWEGKHLVCKFSTKIECENVNVCLKSSTKWPDVSPGLSRFWATASSAESLMSLSAAITRPSQGLFHFIGPRLLTIFPIVAARKHFPWFPTPRDRL